MAGRFCIVDGVLEVGGEYLRGFAETDAAEAVAEFVEQVAVGLQLLPNYRGGASELLLQLVLLLEFEVAGQLALLPLAHTAEVGRSVIFDSGHFGGVGLEFDGSAVGWVELQFNLKASGDLFKFDLVDRHLLVFVLHAEAVLPEEFLRDGTPVGGTALSLALGPGSARVQLDDLAYLLLPPSEPELHFRGLSFALLGLEAVPVDWFGWRDALFYCVTVVLEGLGLLLVVLFEEVGGGQAVDEVLLEVPGDLVGAEEGVEGDVFQLDPFAGLELEDALDEGFGLLGDFDHLGPF